MSKEWDRENMRTVAVNLKKEEAEALKAYAAEHDTTVGALLRGFVRKTLETRGTAGRQVLDVEGYPHTVSYKNTDRLKHETAFHNPHGKNPDGILNEILDRYFAFVASVRK